MKVLKHLLFLVAVIITGRADVIPERTRRDGNQLPAGGKVGTYGSSSVNLNTDSQISVEIGEDGAYKDYGLQTPNGVGGLNEAGESFRAEAKAVAGYEEEGQLNGDNIVDEYGLALPSAGFGYGNQFKTVAQTSASPEVHTGETAGNGGTAQADLTIQAKLHAQFEQGAQHGGDAQADAIIQENQVQNDDGTKVHKPNPQSVMPINELYGTQGSYAPGYLETVRGINPLISGPTPRTEPSEMPMNELMNHPGGFYPELGLVRPIKYSYAANGGTDQADATTQAKLHAQFEQGAQHGGEAQADAIIQENQVQNDVGTKVHKPNPQSVMPMNELYGPPYSDAPGYLETVRGINPLISDPTPRTEPSKYLGTFIGIPQGDTDPYSIYYYGSPVYKHAQPIPPSVLISDTGIEKFKPMANGHEVTQSPNWIKKGSFYNNVNWNPYTKPAQAETLVQADRKIEADALAQENSEPQYQEETRANSMVQTSKGVEVTAPNADAEAKTYDGYNAETQPDVMAQINSGSQYETSALADAAVQSNGGVKYIGENKLTNVAPSYSGGSQYNGGAEPIAQAGSVVETRFGQNTHPPRRPMPGFGYRHPYNVWNHG